MRSNSSKSERPKVYLEVPSKNEYRVNKYDQEQSDPDLYSLQCVSCLNQHEFARRSVFTDFSKKVA